MSGSGAKHTFGFDDDIRSRIEKIDNGELEGKRLSTMGTIIRDTATKSERRFQEAEDVERKKLRYAAKMMDLERKGLDLQLIDIDQIEVDGYTRDRTDVDADELEELKASIAEIGLSNPIRVDRSSDGAFLLNQGLRRLLAFKDLRNAAREQNGDPACETDYDVIPAMISSLESREASYRKMVDENLIRSHISFGELGLLAVAYAGEMGKSIDEAVNELFASLLKSKKSYVRAAAHVLAALGEEIRFPKNVQRTVFSALARKLETPGAAERLKRALAGFPDRTEAEELNLLDRASKGLSLGEETAKQPKAVTKFEVRPEFCPHNFKVTVDEGRITITSKALKGVSQEAIVRAIESLVRKD